MQNRRQQKQQQTTPEAGGGRIYRERWGDPLAVTPGGDPVEWRRPVDVPVIGKHFTKHFASIQPPPPHFISIHFIEDFSHYSTR